MSSIEDETLPSPWATGIGNTEPVISLKNIEGDSLITVCTNLDSNFSEVFLINLGHPSEPGIKLDNKAKV